MRKIITFFVVLCCCFGLNAQTLQPIVLNAPNTNRGASVMKALANRQSVRAFSTQALSLQDLSDLLWAACGINRPDGKRTYPSALNKQDVDLYVVMESGSYLYNPKKQQLDPVASGDHRALVGGRQTFVNDAPVILLMVSDLSRLGKSDEQTKLMAAVDVGCVCENINLFCAATGLATVPRASMETNELKKILKLTDTQIGRASCRERVLRLV